MNKIRIDYERDTDKLTIGFHGDNLGRLNLHDAGYFTYNMRTITADDGRIISISFTINEFKSNRSAALKNISGYKVLLVDNYDSMVDTVMEAEQGTNRVVFDFCQLGDGSWGEVDQTFEVRGL